MEKCKLSDKDLYDLIQEVVTDGSSAAKREAFDVARAALYIQRERIVAELRKEADHVDNDAYLALSLFADALESDS